MFLTTSVSFLYSENSRYRALCVSVTELVSITVTTHLVCREAELSILHSSLGRLRMVVCCSFCFHYEFIFLSDTETDNRLPFHDFSLYTWFSSSFYSFTHFIFFFIQIQKQITNEQKINITRSSFKSTSGGRRKRSYFRFYILQRFFRN